MRRIDCLIHFFTNNETANTKIDSLKVPFASVFHNQGSVDPLGSLKILQGVHGIFENTPLLLALTINSYILIRNGKKITSIVLN
jgi:hypothetical protein